MSSAYSVQPWLRDVGEQSLFAVRYHVVEETAEDAEAVCKTISRDVFFAVPNRTRAGNEIPPGTVLTTYDQVHDYYANRLGSYAVLDSRPLRSVAGDWYVFNDSAATLRGTGQVGDVDATGAEFVVNSAVLFPTAEDGIRGEICVTRHPFDDVVRGSVPQLDPSPASHPAREMRHSARLDALVEALRLGKEDALAALLAPGHTVATRFDALGAAPAIATARDRGEAQKILTALFQGARDIAIVTRIVTDWYVFCEYVADLGGGRVRRFAATHPIENDLFTGTFGYGKEETIAS
ncbi:MAG: hypothetical protein R3F21_09555 [Myxococcota bacterium]